MSVDPSFQTLIEDEKNEWICKNLFPLISVLNIGEDAFQGDRFKFSFPLSKENLIDNLKRITNKHEKLINEELNKFDDVFQKYFDIKVISSDEKYKHVPRGSKNSYWHNIYLCNSSKDSEIFYILKDELVNESRKALEKLKFNPKLILKSIIQNVRSVEDLLYLAILKFASLENQYRERYTFKKDSAEKGNDLNLLLVESEIDEELIEYFSSGKIIDYNSGNHSFNLEFNKLLRLIGKKNHYFATIYTHSFVGTSCHKISNILIEQNTAKEIFGKLDKYPFQKWLKHSYNETKKEIEKDQNNLPLFDYKPRFKLLKWIRESSQPCIFDIEDNHELIEALDSFKKSRILKVEHDDIVIINDNKYLEKFNELGSKNVNRIEKNKRKLLTRWLRLKMDVSEKIEEEDHLIKPKIPEKKVLKPSAPKIEKIHSTEVSKPDLGVLLDEKSLNIFLGNDFKGKKIEWRPLNEPNAHLIIVGQPGVGKTQTLLAIIKELKQQGINSIIFDFKKDYFLLKGKIQNLINIDAKEGITINPLELESEQGTDPKDKKYQISLILKNIYNLGDVQEQMLRNAIKLTYEEAGIIEEDKETWVNTAPNFTQIRKILENMLSSPGFKSNRKEIDRLITRLDPIFDINLFSKKTEIRFDEIINNVTIIDFSQLPTEDLSKVAAEFLLRKIKYYIYKMKPLEQFGDKNFFRFYCIIDEGHRLAYDKSPLADIMRELRSYGIGIILASQRPSDFSNTIFANASTKICLGLPLEKDAKFMEKQISISWKEIKNLKPFNGYFKSIENKKAIMIEIKPFYERN